MTTTQLPTSQSINRVILPDAQTPAHDRLAKELVLFRQLKARKHLSKSQIACMAIESPMAQTMTLTALARKFGVSYSVAKRAVRVRDAFPDEYQRVRNGEVSLSVIVRRKDRIGSVCVTCYDRATGTYSRFSVVGEAFESVVRKIRKSVSVQG